MTLRARLPVVALLVSVAASDPSHAVGTAITYQGRLRQAGVPSNGVCDFRFSLFAASAGGSVLATVAPPPLAVTDGLFTAQLDFGAGAFPGADRWLEIEVRCPTGAGSFTLLAPRQPVTAAPYAQTANLASAVPDGSVTTAKLADLAVTDAKVASGIQYAKLTGAPTALPPTGAAGGDLTGAFPAPSIAADAVGSAEVADGTIAAADVNTSSIQRRVTGTCAAGSSIRQVASDGMVACEPDDGATYTAGTGLGLAGTEFRVLFGGSGVTGNAARADHTHGPIPAVRAQSPSESFNNDQIIEPGGGGEAVVFDEELYDTMDMHTSGVPGDGTGSQFRAPIAGLYAIDAGLIFNEPTGGGAVGTSRQLLLRTVGQNGVLLGAVQVAPRATGATILNVSATTFLAAGAAVELLAQHDAATSIVTPFSQFGTFGDGRHFFSMTWLGSTQ